jgi:hypothetical protein
MDNKSSQCGNFQICITKVTMGATSGTGTA